MSVYHIALLIAAIVAGLLSYKTPRAIWWILALAASFIISVLYLYWQKPYFEGVWWPPAAAIAFMCDAGVFLLIREFKREKWETWVGNLALLAASINLLYLTGIVMGWPPLPGHEMYAIILEAINYAALLIIGGTGILNRLGSAHGHTPAGGTMGALHTLNKSLHQEAPGDKVLSKW